MKAIFFSIIEKILKVLAKIKLPTLRERLTYAEKNNLIEALRPGDIILIRSLGELTSYFFGVNGFSHVMIYVGNGLITDATTKGVSTRHLADSLDNCSRTAICRPKLSEEEIAKALEKYKWLKGLDEKDNIEYNYNLVSLEIRPDGAPEAFTCAQYARWFVNQGRKDFMHFVNHMGFMTVSPEDFYEARGKFDLIKEYNEYLFTKEIRIDF